MNKSVLRISLNQPLESITCTAGLDWILCGSSSGLVFILDFSVLAIGFSAGNAQIIHIHDNHKNTAFSQQAGNKKHDDGLPDGVTCIAAHNKAVTCLVTLKDLSRFISCSEDGMLKIWHLMSRQLLKEIVPLNKAPITNCKVL